MFPGFSERLTKEITALAPPSCRIKVIAPPERKNSVWLTLMPSIFCFLANYINKQEIWIGSEDLFCYLSVLSRKGGFQKMNTMNPGHQLSIGNVNKLSWASAT